METENTDAKSLADDPMARYDALSWILDDRRPETTTFFEYDPDYTSLNYFKVPLAGVECVREL